MSIRTNTGLSAPRERRPGGAAKGRVNTRTQRTAAPYGTKFRSSSATTEASLKFLLPKISHSGCLIGASGETIRELMEVTGADIHISDIGDVYPGTSDRVVYITGSADSVNSVVELIWHMIGKIAVTEEGERAVWSPKSASESLDEILVEGKITIPITAAGSIIGAGGSNIRSLIEESGAQVVLSDGRREPKNTMERIVTISGTVLSCTNATKSILTQLVENPDIGAYTTKGTKYPAVVPKESVETGRRGKNVNTATDRYSKMSNMGDIGVASTISTMTTITVAVPNPLIGNILGKQGETLKEIISLSRANITISNKGEYIEGTNNRVVTISGEPAAAQTAHTLISNILSSLE